MRMSHSYLLSLEIDGKVFTQSISIARYLATKFGLAGDEEFEILRMEESVYIMAEYIRKWVPLFYDAIPENVKTEMRERILAVDNVQVMNYYDKLIKKNEDAGNEWLVGKKLSWADIVFAHCTSAYQDCLMKADILKDYPRLQALRTRVFEEPRIKEYVANRPLTKF